MRHTTDECEGGSRSIMKQSLEMGVWKKTDLIVSSANNSYGQVAFYLSKKVQDDAFKCPVVEPKDNHFNMI